MLWLSCCASCGKVRAGKVFNILINNVDDHLNNHGFLHVAYGQWRLAPAFDLNPFPDQARALTTWVSQESGDASCLTDALRVAGQFNLDAQAARNILDEVRESVAKWRPMARNRHERRGHHTLHTRF